MPATILTNCAMYLHDTDFSGVSNSVTLQMSAEDADVTVFGNNGYRSRIAGLKNVEANFEGFWESSPDLSAFTNLAVGDQVATIAPDIAEGTKAFGFQTGRFNYELFGAVGDPNPYMVDLQSSNTVGIVRGLITRAKGNVSATGVLGSPQQVGAGGAGKFVYAGLHVFGTPGTTMTVQVQSDNAVGFPSVTTVATFPAITAAGGYWLTRVNASAITDDWWRLNVSAITGTFTISGWIAVQ